VSLGVGLGVSLGVGLGVGEPLGVGLGVSLGVGLGEPLGVGLGSGVVGPTITQARAVLAPRFVATVMVAPPPLTPVTNPVSSTEATAVFEDDHVTVVSAAFSGVTTAEN
jgi:hypothetical protein